MSEVTSNTVAVGNLPTSMNYYLLRELGIKHLEDLSGKIWTDFNAHDPGVTMLEVLCFAIMDLGYRTNLSMTDLLTPQTGSGIHNFYTLKDIAVNAPLTMNDYRKMMIDQDGIRFGWLKKTSQSINEQEVKGIYDVALQLEDHDQFDDLGAMAYTHVMANSDPNSAYDQLPATWKIVFEYPEWSNLPSDYHTLAEPATPTLNTVDDLLTVDIINWSDSYRITKKYTITDGTTTTTLTIHGRMVIPDDEAANIGQYKTAMNAVFLAEKDNLAIDFLNRWKETSAIAGSVIDKLNSNRNLCEDFATVEVPKPQKVGLNVDIEMVPDADKAEIMAQVHWAVYKRIQPNVKFYSLREMLDKGYSMEEIFRGPALNNGFLDETELNILWESDRIYHSDVIDAIMNVPGVKSRTRPVDDQLPEWI